ncbi:hypothetical protein [Enemella sp. A6]|uniref:hypothetical protein n=1 Tax=Enemella sp. A6 TaxID=3440152 RepID=UPI003EBE52CE
MSEEPDLSAILQDLAEGRIDAAEASQRIDALKNDPTDDGSTSEHWAAERRQHPGRAEEVFEPGSAAPEDPEPPPSQRRTGSAKGVERVSVHAVGRRVRIVGERGVATAAADGPHVLRRNGSTLEISSDGEIGASIDGFTLLRPPRSLDDLRNLGLGKELFIRVNPNVVVDVEVTAGRLQTEDVPYLGKVRVTAGGARIEGVKEISDALIQAGQATIKGEITTGRSRIRSESGSLHVHLDDDSNVTVRAEAQLGRVVWTGGHSGSGDEVVMGNGSARLDVGVVMGQAKVRVGSTPEDGEHDE